MSDSDENAGGRLLGIWNLVENSSNVIPDRVLTMTFTPDGKLVSVIRDGNESSFFHHEYSVCGDEITTIGPEEYENPNHVRSKFWFDEAGNLIMDDRGIRSLFRRV
jgi:hypothetical protein